MDINSTYFKEKSKEYNQTGIKARKEAEDSFSLTDTIRLDICLSLPSLLLTRSADFFQSDLFRLLLISMMLPIAMTATTNIRDFTSSEEVIAQFLLLIKGFGIVMVATASYFLFDIFVETFLCNGILGKHHYEFNALGFEESTPYNHDKIQWGNIQAIEEGKRNIQFALLGGRKFTIPKNQFQNDEETSKFILTITDLWNRSENVQKHSDITDQTKNDGTSILVTTTRYHRLVSNFINFPLVAGRFIFTAFVALSAFAVTELWGISVVSLFGWDAFINLALSCARYGASYTALFYFAAILAEFIFDHSKTNPRRYSIDDHGIRIHSALREQNFPWVGILNIRLLGPLIIIRSTDYGLHILPRHAFPDKEAFHSFFKQAQHHWISRDKNSDQVNALY